MSTKRNKGLKKSEQKVLEQKIRKLIAKNYSDDEIRNELRLQPHVLRHYRNRILLTNQIRLTHMTSQTVFDEYVMHAMENIRMLDEALVEMGKRKRTYTASVQALRLKGQIVRSVINVARQLGLISRRAREITVGDNTFRLTT